MQKSLLTPNFSTKRRQKLQGAAWGASAGAGRWQGRPCRVGLCNSCGALSHQVRADAPGGEGEAAGGDLQRHRAAEPRVRRPARAGQAPLRLLHQVLPSDQSQGEGHPDRKDDRQISQFLLLSVSSFFPSKWFAKLTTQLLQKAKTQNTKPKKNPKKPHFAVGSDTFQAASETQEMFLDRLSKHYLKKLQVHLIKYLKPGQEFEGHLNLFVFPDPLFPFSLSLPRGYLPHYLFKVALQLSGIAVPWGISLFLSGKWFQPQHILMWCSFLWSSDEFLLFSGLSQVTSVHCVGAVGILGEWAGKSWKNKE